MTHEIFIALWNRALEEEVGIAVETDDRRWLSRCLYEARQAEGDPALQALIIMMPAKCNEVWICQKNQSLTPLI